MEKHYFFANKRKKVFVRLKAFCQVFLCKLFYTVLYTADIHFLLSPSFGQVFFNETDITQQVYLLSRRFKNMSFASKAIQNPSKIVESRWKYSTPVPRLFAISVCQISGPTGLLNLTLPPPGWAKLVTGLLITRRVGLLAENICK